MRPRRAYLNVSAFASLDAYLATCKRSVFRSLTGQVDAAMAEARVTVTTRRAAPLRWEHFAVILAHERRQYAVARALVHSMLRWVGWYTRRGRGR